MDVGETNFITNNDFQCNYNFPFPQIHHFKIEIVVENDTATPTLGETSLIISFPFFLCLLPKFFFLSFPRFSFRLLVFSITLFHMSGSVSGEIVSTITCHSHALLVPGASRRFAKQNNITKAKRERPGRECVFNSQL